MSSSGSGTVINYGSGSDFLTSYGSGYGSGSTSQKVTVPTVPVPVPQHCFLCNRESTQRLFKAPECKVPEEIAPSQIRGIMQGPKLKGHGNEADFLGFLHKSVRHRSFTLHFEPFRFWLRIRGDIRNRKSSSNDAFLKIK